MERLFDSDGKHIANFRDGELFTPSGKNVGHYSDEHGIFVDIYGRYLGEIMTGLSPKVKGARLMYNESSEYIGWGFGGQGSLGSIGNLGSPGTMGTIGNIPGFKDVELGS